MIKLILLVRHKGKQISVSVLHQYESMTNSGRRTYGAEMGVYKHAIIEGGDVWLRSYRFPVLYKQRNTTQLFVRGCETAFDFTPAVGNYGSTARAKLAIRRIIEIIRQVNTPTGISYKLLV